MTSLVRIVVGLIGAVVGVIALQIIALPVFMLLYGVFWCLQHVIGRLDGPAQVAWNIIVILSMLGVFLVAAITGLVSGWGVALRVAGGTSVAGALAGSRVFGKLLRR